MIVQELVAQLGLDIDELGFSRADGVLKKLRLGYAAFGAAALGALAAGALGIAHATAEAGDQARKLSQSTGVNSIFLQEFAYAAKLADVSVDQMAQGLRFMAKSGVKDLRAGMLQLSDQMQKMPNDGARVKLAIDKLGKSGAKLIPALAGGRKELEALFDEAHAFGNVISEEDQKASEAFNDELTRLSATFIGLRNAIGVKLLRPLTALITGFRVLVQDMRKGEAWVQKLTLAFKVFAFVLGGVVLAALVANAGAIATAISWYVALGIASAVAAAKAAAAWLIAAAPAILLVAAFTALLLILEDVKVYLEGGDSMIGRIGPKWSAFLDSFTKLNTAGDPWWLTALKAGVANARRLIGYAQDIEGAFNKMFGVTSGQRLTDAIGGWASRVNSGSVFKGLGNATQFTPEAPRILGPAGAGASVHAPVTINIAPSAGASAGDIADAVETRINDHHKATLRQAAAAVE